MNRLPISYMELEAIYTRTLGAGVRTLAVTSAVSGEGVTTIAEALARRMNAGGHRALLVELNLFHPELTRHMGLERSHWLPNEPTSMQAVVQRDGFGFLSAPVSPDAPMRFREHAVLQGAIARWLQNYDAVVFDTSPLNAVNQGNIPAEQVCAVCDGALMVVLAGRTTESAVREAGQRLRDSGARLLGTVINDYHNPTLASELLREVGRLGQYWPRLAAWLRGRVRTSALLNAPV